MRKFGRSTSDYAQEHFFSMENVIDLAVDSFVQLRTQRWIGEIPKRLGLLKDYGKVAGTTENIIRRLNPNASSEMIEALVKATPAYRVVEQGIQKWSNVSTAISRAYLIATSTEDVQGGADRAAEEARRRASAGQAGNVNRTTTGLGSSSGSTTLGL